MWQDKEWIDYIDNFTDANGQKLYTAPLAAMAPDGSSRGANPHPFSILAVANWVK
jgi:hypothetical protein